VMVANRTDEIAAVAIQGPRSCEVLAPLVEAELEDLPYYRAIATTTVAGGPAMVSRTGFSGELGYEVFVFGGSEHAVRLWDAVIEAGAAPMGLDAVEMLRIEAGLLIADEDYITGASDPVELSLDAFIDLDGPRFVGRDAVASRIVSRTSTLVTISFDRLADAEPVPAADRPVIGDGLEVGRTTSVQRTPRFGTIALAVVDTAWTADGTSVVVEGEPATVRPRPIDGGDRARWARPARPSSASPSAGSPQGPRL
jgi:aminomethyltransferase